MNFRNALLSATLLARFRRGQCAADHRTLYRCRCRCERHAEHARSTPTRFCAVGDGNLKSRHRIWPAWRDGPWGFGNGLRAEIEGDVMRNSPFNQVSGGATTRPRAVS